MVFYSHNTALSYWFRRAIANPPQPLPESSISPAGERFPSAKDIVASCPIAPDEGEPIHVIGSRLLTRSKSARIHYHYAPDNEPQGSYLVVSDNVIVASPEAAFLQMSEKLPFVDLVKLGYQLCSGFALTDTDIDMRGFCSCEPITTSNSIASYVMRSEARRGIKKCRRALSYILDNTASPREVAAAMLLTLPTSEGGFGFALPEPNGMIPLSSKAQRDLGRRYLRADLLWRSKKTVIEYDSDRWHTGEERIGYDSRRRNLLKSLGFEVITVTNNEIKNAQAMARIACALARALGVRLRIRSAEFEMKRRALMDKLV